MTRKEIDWLNAVAKDLKAQDINLSYKFNREKAVAQKEYETLKESIGEQRHMIEKRINEIGDSK